MSSPSSNQQDYWDAHEPLTRFDDTRFRWLNDPTKWVVPDESDPSTEGFGGSFTVTPSNLTLSPPSKKDFWRRTFYNPTLIKADASAYVCEIPPDTGCTVEVSFSFTPVEQFDQCGIFVWLDDSHWIKTGIEYADGGPRLSCVVCNVFSDWSVQPWQCNAAKIRVHKVVHNSSVVVEAALPGTDKWEFVRIAHISSRAAHLGIDNEPEACGSIEEKPWYVGPFAACALEQRGCVATFSDLKISKPVQTTHHSDSGCA